MFNKKVNASFIGSLIKVSDVDKYLYGYGWIFYKKVNEKFKVALQKKKKKNVRE